MKFEDIQIVFIVNPSKKQNFSEWLVSLGLKWFEKDFEDLKIEMREKNILLIEDDNPKLEKLVEQLNESLGKTIWFIGCNWLLPKINPFNHYFFNTRQEWDLFKLQRPDEYNLFINETASNT